MTLDSAAESAERERLSALASYGVLDTSQEQNFDDLTHLAAELCNCPTSLISFVGPDRQWFKARVGFPLCGTDLNSSVCRFVLTGPDVLVIPDLAADQRTATNPLVTGDPHIRFYAGAPLRTADGHVLGSLCVIDTEPRPAGLSERQAGNLRRLARQVIELLELRRLLRERTRLARDAEEAGVRKVALSELGDLLRASKSEAAMAHVTAGVIGRTLKAERAGYGSVDPRRELIDIVADWCAPEMTSIAGRHRFRDFGDFIDDLRQSRLVAVADVRADPRTRGQSEAWEALGVRALIAAPVMEHGELAALCFVHWCEPRIISAEEQAFSRSAADRTQVGVARIRAEENQGVLNGELSHRLKNTLAMVQAIAAQTLKGSASSDALRAFDARLLALSKAHELLLKAEWEAADLAAVASEVLGAAGAGDGCTLRGPAVSLGPRATLSTSLLLHELCTNAQKYGALSRPGGCVALDWRWEGGGDDAELVVDWTERGGPPVTPPARKGFGSRLLSLGLTGTGASELAYENVGFSASFRALRRQVEQA